jgi:hypothetical protein
MTVGQVFILFFMAFCRTQVLWQVFAVLASPILFFRLAGLRRLLRNPGLLPANVKLFALQIWPAILTGGGLVALLIYGSLALDHKWYKGDESHVVWHALYSGMISASPELSALYLHGHEKFGDNISYDAVLRDLTERHDTSSSIAEFKDGALISFDYSRNTAEYDVLVRRVFFNVVRAHPWLALKAFLLDMPLAQIKIFKEMNLFDPLQYVGVALLTLMALGLSLWAGAPWPQRSQIISAVPPILLVSLLSWIPTMIVPTNRIPDTIMFHTVLASAILAYLVYYNGKGALGKIPAR